MIVRSLPKIGLLLLLAVTAFAQRPAQQADQQFAKMAYSEAAALYEQALQQAAYPNQAASRLALSRLGYCYRQLRDSQNAERVYRNLIGDGNVPANQADAYLYYAQALVSNGKYKEAQEAYDTYTAQQNADGRIPELSTKVFRDVSALTNNTAATYRVKFLDINTRKPEFSPMYYRNGLVFVTEGGRAKGYRQVFKGSNTASYLDLYFVPELSALGSTDALASQKSSRAAQRLLQKQSYTVLGSDDFTPRTANDSRTVGVFGSNQVTAGDGYGLEPVSETERFGRSLNTKYHEGPATFSRDGSQVIFTRNNFNNGQVGRSADGVNKLKLYTARQTNGVWGTIEEMPFNSDDYSTGHPTLSRDGLRLYFASDMPGGYGGTDLYISRWEGTRWSVPMNLGPEVNTKGNELFPFIDEKNNLYFASNGLPGLGELDLFYAKMTPDGKPTNVVKNLGEPFNSTSDDFGIVTDGNRKSGYFSSNRKHGGADDDIYRFDREGSLYPCRQLTVSVYDEATKEPLPQTQVMIEGGEPGNERKELVTDEEGTIRLCVDAESDFHFTAMRNGYVDTRMGFSTRNLDDDQPSRLELALERPIVNTASVTTRTGELISGTVKRQTGHVVGQADGRPLRDVRVLLTNECTNEVNELLSDSNGAYSFTTLTGCEYRLEGKYKRMASKVSRINRDGSGDPNLTMFSSGVVLRVDDIYYDKNQSIIRSDAAQELDKLVMMLETYPNMSIELRSHTDSRGSDTYNKTLSSARAKAAINYIASKGIAKSRLKAKGYGETSLVNDCANGVDCTEEQHQQNRRTEIKILRIE
ncbi:OmpA family protein [Fibrella sp. WM1]|uniref:OmpA family protein n=1 Tax=Fibrella musci TaxID=3242485 RepID=UPI003521C297